MRKEAEQHKAEILRRLQERRSKPKPSEVLEAEKVIAKYREKEAEADEQASRALLPLPPGNPCPACFVKRGITSHMVPISSSTYNDLFECKECSLVIEVKP
jgi:hypothetical protein